MESAEGKAVYKHRYLLSGVTGPADQAYGFWALHGAAGLFNFGKYSVENVREYARDIAANELKDKIDKWMNDPNADINKVSFDFWGHSRGAVTAGQTVKFVDKWITDHMKEKYHASDEKIQEFKKKFIHYDLRLDDPVAGWGTDVHMGSCDLKNIPNVNATVRCSMAIGEIDFTFPLQHVRGAKKIILSVKDHQDFYPVDETQMNETGKKHRGGYFDAETGEMYRESGISELPDGIYFEDENRNMIRVNSFRQVQDMFSSLYENSSPQRIRSRRIHKMVRDWFCENELESSFADENEHTLEDAKFVKNGN